MSKSDDDPPVGCCCVFAGTVILSGCVNYIWGNPYGWMLFGAVTLALGLTAMLMAPEK